VLSKSFAANSLDVEYYASIDHDVVSGGTTTYKMALLDNELLKTLDLTQPHTISDHFTDIDFSTDGSGDSNHLYQVVDGGVKVLRHATNQPFSTAITSYDDSGPSISTTPCNDLQSYQLVLFYNDTFASQEVQQKITIDSYGVTHNSANKTVDVSINVSQKDGTTFYMYSIAFVTKQTDDDVFTAITNFNDLADKSIPNIEVDIASSNIITVEIPEDEMVFGYSAGVTMELYPYDVLDTAYVYTVVSTNDLSTSTTLSNSDSFVNQTVSTNSSIGDKIAMGSVEYAEDGSSVKVIRVNVFTNKTDSSDSQLFIGAYHRAYIDGSPTPTLLDYATEITSSVSIGLDKTAIDLSHGYDGTGDISVTDSTDYEIYVFVVETSSQTIKPQTIKIKKLDKQLKYGWFDHTVPKGLVNVEYVHGSRYIVNVQDTGYIEYTTDNSSGSSVKTVTPTSSEGDAAMSTIDVGDIWKIVCVQTSGTTWLIVLQDRKTVFFCGNDNISEKVPWEDSYVSDITNNTNADFHDYFSPPAGGLQVPTIHHISINIMNRITCSLSDGNFFHIAYDGSEFKSYPGQQIDSAGNTTWLYGTGANMEQYIPVGHIFDGSGLYKMLSTVKKPIGDPNEYWEIKESLFHKTGDSTEMWRVTFVFDTSVTAQYSTLTVQSLLTHYNLVGIQGTIVGSNRSHLDSNLYFEHKADGTQLIFRVKDYGEQTRIATLSSVAGDSYESDLNDLRVFIGSDYVRCSGQTTGSGVYNSFVSTSEKEVYSPVTTDNIQIDYTDGPIYDRPLRATVDTYDPNSLGKRNDFDRDSAFSRDFTNLGQLNALSSLLEHYRATWGTYPRLLITAGKANYLGVMMGH